MGLAVVSIAAALAVAFIWSRQALSRSAKWLLTTLLIVLAVPCIVLLFAKGFECGLRPRSKSTNYIYNLVDQKTDKHIQDSLPVTASSIDTTTITPQAAAKGDTIFLQKHRSSSHDAIFIDTNKESNSYSQIINFDFDEYDEETYSQSLSYLHKNGIMLTKKRIEGLPKHWLPLYLYKGNFYAYKPCDFISHYKVSITDTAFIDYYSEGPIASKIIHFEKLGENTFRLQLTGMYAQGRILTINLIDKQNHIAVFAEGDGEKAACRLMVAANKIRNFPIVVNRCEEMKAVEFEFDKPDFSVLLNSEKSP